MTVADKVLDELDRAHRAIVDAGRAYVAGDLRGAAELLRDVRVEVADVEADLRRAHDAAAVTP